AVPAGSSHARTPPPSPDRRRHACRRRTGSSSDEQVVVRAGFRAPLRSPGGDLLRGNRPALSVGGERPVAACEENIERLGEVGIDALREVLCKADLDEPRGRWLPRQRMGGAAQARVLRPFYVDLDEQALIHVAALEKVVERGEPDR